MYPSTIVPLWWWGRVVALSRWWAAFSTLHTILSIDMHFLRLCVWWTDQTVLSEGRPICVVPINTYIRTTNTHKDEHTHSNQKGAHTESRGYFYLETFVCVSSCVSSSTRINALNIEKVLKICLQYSLVLCACVNQYTKHIQISSVKRCSFWPSLVARCEQNQIQKLHQHAPKNIHNICANAPKFNSRVNYAVTVCALRRSPNSALWRNGVGVFRGFMPCVVHGLKAWHERVKQTNICIYAATVINLQINRIAPKARKNETSKHACAPNTRRIYNTRSILGARTHCGQSALAHSTEPNTLKDALVQPS